MEKHEQDTEEAGVLDMFHRKNSRTIIGVTWKDKVTIN